MHFLEPPRVMRTPSTEEFVVEEDKASDVDTNSSRRESLSTGSYSSNSSPQPQTKPWNFRRAVSIEGGQAVKVLLAGLSITCLVLCLVLAVFAVLYFNVVKKEEAAAQAHYEVCKTKTCARTAFTFMQHIDETVNPCEDFQKFACGSWLAETASTTTQGTYDHTTVMRDRITGRLKNIVLNITNYDIEPLRQVKLLYDTCVDTDSIEQLGLTPLTDLLDDLIHKNSNISLGKLVARIKKVTGQSYLFDLSLSSDYRDPRLNAIFLDQPELPVDGSAFGDDSSTGDSYRKLINDAFSQLNKVETLVPSIQQHVSNGSDIVFNLEKQMTSEMSDFYTMSKAAMFNLYSLRDLNRIYADTLRSNRNNGFTGVGVKFDWVEYMTELFGDVPGVSIDWDTHVIVNDLNYIKALAGIIANSTREELDVYLGWQIIYSFGKDVSKDFRNLFYDFSQLMDGSETAPGRRSECIDLLDSNIPFALTYRYILNYVSDSLIKEADEMVKHLLQAFKARVSSLTWMDKNTKYRALLKAEKMRAYMGYPKWMKNETAVIRYFRGLSMSNFSFFENILVMKKWETKKALKQVKLPVDQTWSSDSPAEADAFYDDELNAITFPSGFLQPPFFGMGLRSIDYGALGSVIGHEITHGFDMRGRYSDENGRLNSWWSVPTLLQFTMKAQCFVKQYDNYRIPELEAQLGDKNHLNGRKTRNENIADNGGVREAFFAYRYYVKSRGKPEERLPGLEQYTPEQLFFLSFAQSWCAYNNPSALLDSIYSNEHSPSRFRIIGPLQNFEEFSQVWKCKAGSFMNPPDKCVLW